MEIVRSSKELWPLRGGFFRFTITKNFSDQRSLSAILPAYLHSFGALSAAWVPYPNRLSTFYCSYIVHVIFSMAIYSPVQEGRDQWTDER